MWSVPAARAEALCALDDDGFNRQLTAAFDGRLGLCKVEGARSAIPLTARYARDFARERLVLVGMRPTPSTRWRGRGNLGLLDAAALAEQILIHHGKGADIGLLANLRGYERWRKSEAARMLAAMEGSSDCLRAATPQEAGARGGASRRRRSWPPQAGHDPGRHGAGWGAAHPGQG